LLERNEIDGLIDDTTIGQLSSIQYEIDSRGRMMIESKQKVRQRGVASPDRAEALMLALGKPIPIMEWRSIRDLEDPKSPFLMAQTVIIVHLGVVGGMVMWAISDGEGSRACGDSS
jgi:hypothetical protein